ncbi:hypothetical protein ABJI51_15025 [Amycolatopsis sp. NEAU-NG30]|uniref:Uncharacterized protein n=1 Tax=Amycolatopsis melonis TaxID=3156488 RepID=A0ABV0LDM4_9PSEU
MFAGLWGAAVTLDDAPEGPPAGTGDSLLLLVAALGAGAGLVGVLVSIRTADPPRRSVVDTFQPVPVFAVVAMAAVFGA